jgi:hypothetical protein
MGFSCSKDFKWHFQIHTARRGSGDVDHGGANETGILIKEGEHNDKEEELPKIQPKPALKKVGNQRTARNPILAHKS